jgi:hypothetical protein
VAGATKPLLRHAPLLCPEIHGESGLDGPLGGPVLPPAPHAALPGKAPVVMFERISAAHRRLVANNGSGGDRASPRVHLVTTAALTNVALLLALYPEVAHMIEASGWLRTACGCGHSALQTNTKKTKDPAAFARQASRLPLDVVPSIRFCRCPPSCCR